MEVDPASLFDVMVKRLHEYKRQLLKTLHIVALYHRAGGPSQRGHRTPDFCVRRESRTGLLHGQAHHQADSQCGSSGQSGSRPCAGDLKVVFPANFNVSMAQTIYPAADISEQISLAGKEASGTGNMKLP